MLAGLSIEKLLTRLDASDASVLIVGETGVGKDVMARSLHARSRRAARPFVALNCAAFTESLFESELFGHESGAFTGAAQAKIGLIEAAAGGTVFLDEVGDMPLGLQAKLLRLVENREFLRVGGLQPRWVDARFIFATNHDLRRDVENKTFRSDLFFRISTVTLKIPPLRQRPDDIVPLARHFLDAGATRLHLRVPALADEARELIEGHTWPGNARELKNVIELALLVHEGDTIHASDIHVDGYAPGMATLPPRAAPPDIEAERAQILEALAKTGGNQSAAAALIGMARRTFVKRLADHGIRPRRKREA